MFPKEQIDAALNHDIPIPDGAIGATEIGDKWVPVYPERPIVWPVGAAIPIKEEEEVADADATLEARASRSNPEE